MVAAYENGTKKTFSTDFTKKLGSVYGDFIGGLTQSFCVRLCDIIEGAFTKYGSNELLLADLFCFCTTVELQELKTYYDKKHQSKSKPITLQRTVDSHSIENFPFWEFMGLILSVERRHDSINDSIDSSKYAAELHRAGLGNPNVTRNDELILSHLAVMSRRQCLFVSQSFQQRFNCTLSEALTNTYGGSCLRALLVWTSPRSRALAMILERILSSGSVDSNLLCFALSRSEKALVASALPILKSISHIDMDKTLKKVFKGNCQLAVLCWCFEPSIDEGAEYRLAELSDLFRYKGCASNRDGVCANEIHEIQEEMRSLLAAQHDRLLQYAESIDIAKDIPEFESFDMPVDIGASVSSSTPDLHLYDTASVSMEDYDSTGAAESDAVDLDTSYPDLVECLELWLALLDTHQQDSIPLERFLDFMVSLGAGFTLDSASNLVHEAGWAHSNWVVYPEIVADLAVHTVDTMRRCDLDVNERVDAMWQQYTVEAERAWGECAEGEGGGDQYVADATEEGRVCEELVSYLKDTFDYYDSRLRSYLNPDEMTSLIRGVFLKEDKSEINMLRVSDIVYVYVVALWICVTVS